MTLGIHRRMKQIRQVSSNLLSILETWVPAQMYGETTVQNAQMAILFVYGTNEGCQGMGDH